MEEWDGEFPTPGLSTSSLSFWVIQLLPQLRSVPVFHCPSDPSDSRFSYLLNGWIFEGYKEERISLNDIKSPSQMIAVCERDHEGGNLDYYPWRPLAHWKPRIAHTRHNGGSNYMFIGGHARWYRFEQTYDPPHLDMHNLPDRID